MKTLKELIESFGLLGTLGIFFFFVSAVAVIGPAVLDPKTLAGVVTKPSQIVAVLAGSLSLIFFVASILKKKPPESPDLVSDKVVLRQEILPHFERDAFKLRTSTGKRRIYAHYIQLVQRPELHSQKA
jgi:hypothetical protein